MPNLYNWYIKFHCKPDICLAWGEVTGHDKLPDSMNIHTSIIQDIKYNKASGIVTIHTVNNRYTCSLKDLDKKTQKIEVVKIPDTISWKRVILSILSDYKSVKKSKPDLRENTVLLVLNNSKPFYFDSMYTRVNDKSDVLQHAFPHIGTFQDSVICQMLPGKIDIRYFPYQNRNIEFYSVAPKHLRWQIKNSGNAELRIEINGKIYEIPPAKRITIWEPNGEQKPGKVGLQLSSTRDLYEA